MDLATSRTVSFLLQAPEQEAAAELEDVLKKMSPFKYILLIILFYFFASSEAISKPLYPPADDQATSLRKEAVYAGYAAGIAAGYTGLYHLWYRQNGLGRFSFKNDNRHWLQMDKAGHFVTASQLGEYGINLLRWAGVDDKTAILQGGASGLLFLTGIEIFDGFATGYGFSWGDQLANVLGAAFVTGQELMWREQRFRLKFSYLPSPYADYRPELLGKNLIQSWLKDYNGQTYWLSFSPGSFGNKSSFPEWLCFSFGYSAGGMTGAHTNPEFNKAGEPIPDFTRYRQYFFSMDIDLTRIHSESRFLRTVFTTFGFIKIPFSVMEYNKLDGVKFRPVYF